MSAVKVSLTVIALLGSVTVFRFGCAPAIADLSAESVPTLESPAPHKSLIRHPRSSRSPELLSARRIGIVTNPSVSDDRLESVFRKMGANFVDVREENFYTLFFPKEISVDMVRWKRSGIIRHASPSMQKDLAHPLVLDAEDEHQKLIVAVPNGETPQQVRELLRTLEYTEPVAGKGETVEVTAEKGHLLTTFRAIQSLGLEVTQMGAASAVAAASAK